MSRRERETRLDRLMRHLERVVGPFDAIVERVEEASRMLPPLDLPLPPPLPPIPVRLGGGLCEREVKRVVLSFYQVLREELGEQRARSIVERAARLYAGGGGGERRG